VLRYEQIVLRDDLHAGDTRQMPDMAQLASLIRPVFVIVQKCGASREDDDGNQDDGGARRSR